MGELTPKRLIKKYPNRRLYDTATSCYITLEDVKQLVLEDANIQVVDAKTQEDITRCVLLQIILEEESGEGIPLFSAEVLTQLIRFYGHAMQGLMGSYLEKNIEVFVQMQHKLQDQIRSVYGDAGLVNNNLWSEFLKFQGPPMQNMMTGYLEQSTNMFVDMQKQLQDRTRTLFENFRMPTWPNTPTTTTRTTGGVTTTSTKSNSNSTPKK